MSDLTPDISSNKRNSNIEILRILSMLFIIAHHYAVHGFDLSAGSFTVNEVTLQILSLGGKIGVNVFVFITGYFMINSRFDAKKLLKLILATTFYSLMIVSIAGILGLPGFSIYELFKSFLPVIFSAYWFATTYLFLYLLSPFLNKFIRSMDKFSLLKLILILTTIWCVLPSVTGLAPEFSNLGWFITLYLIAGFLRLYPMAIFSKSKLNVILSLCSFGLIILNVIIFDLISVRIFSHISDIGHFGAMNNLLILFCSITLFFGFLNARATYNSYINRIAQSTFGVYLIHDNNLLRPLLWEDIFRTRTFLHSDILILHAVFAIISVFLVCTLIDQIRIVCFEKPLFTIINRKIDSRNASLSNVDIPQ